MKKSLITLFNFTLALTLLLVVGVNPVVAVGTSVAIAYSLNYVPTIYGAAFTGFITNGSEWHGKEMENVILRPIFIGQLPQEMGVRIFLSVKSSMKLTFFGPVSKLLKAYADGFQGGVIAPKKQKKLILSEFKAEAQYSKQDYKNMVLENITDIGGLNQNELTGAVLNAEIALFMSGVKEDIRRIFWLGDTAKKYVAGGLRYDSSAPLVLNADGTYASGGADIYYNVIDGIWKALFTDASTTPSSDQIKRIVISNSTVAQVDTHTLTGTSGTANIVINGVAYLATFATSLTVTATNFATTNAVALAALGITVTHSGVTVILTAALPGQPFLSVAAANASGDLAGTLANTTANTPAQALATDEAKATFKAMYEGSNKILKSLLGKQTQVPIATPTADNPTILMYAGARFYATDTMIENYMTSLEAGSGTVPQQYFNLIDGIQRITYRGIPIMPMDIDQHIGNDWDTPYPHRAILTMPENLALVLNGAGDIAETKFWFNPDLNVNRQRTQFEFGANYILPELITVAF